MKKVLMMLFLSVGVIAGSYAQDAAKTAQEPVARKTAAERAEMQTKRMTEELKLTADQATKVQAINLEIAQKVDAVRADQKAVAELKTQKEEKITSVLTEVREDESREESKNGGTTEGESIRAIMQKGHSMSDLFL